MEISVDPRLCEANEVCVGLAPGVFELDDDEMLRIHQPEGEAGHVEQVLKAVAACPKGALSMSGNDADTRA